MTWSMAPGLRRHHTRHDRERPRSGYRPYESHNLLPGYSGRRKM